MAEWAAEGRCLAVAVVGAGFIGTGAVYQLERSAWTRPALVVNRTIERGVAAFVRSGCAPSDIVVSDDPARLSEAIAAHRPAVTGSGRLLTEVEGLDVVIEATGTMDYGARIMLGALRAGVDVVSMNAEVDATIGHLLHHSARSSGAVYTVADGDQPGVLLRQIEFVAGMGFEIVAALNCKRNLNLYQNPDDSRAYATRDGTSILMTTAFGDGTKMQIENAVVANCTGLVPDRRGMHGVRTTIADTVADVTAALGRRGVVEYTLGGDFGGGVGVIGYAEEPDMVQPYMRYSKMGDGPDYFFFRPYHLLHFELPLTVAEVAVDRQPLGVPVGAPVAEVVAVAKQDLHPGDQLDGIGGFCCYGHVDAAAEAQGLLPIGLAEHARLTSRVARDEPIALDAVELDEDADMVRLRRQQDALLADSFTGSGPADGTARTGQAVGGEAGRG